MRSLDKPRDPSSTRMIPGRRLKASISCANSCSRQTAQSLDLLRVWLRNPRASATESFFASRRGSRMSTTSRSDGGMAPSVTKIAKQSAAWASATPTWTATTSIGMITAQSQRGSTAQSQRGCTAQSQGTLRTREGLVSTVAVMRVFRQVVAHCLCPPRECCPQCISAEGSEGV